MLIGKNPATNVSPTSLEEVLQIDPSLRAINESFSQASPAEIDRCVYVMEQEYAIVLNDDQNVELIGSDDATTCHIVFIRSPFATFVAHCNGTKTREFLEEAFNEMSYVHKQLGLNNRSSSSESDYDYEVYVIGGFMDDRKLSHKETKAILSALCNVEARCYLRLFFVLEANTVRLNELSIPKFCGAAINLRTGVVKPATFSTMQRGPDYHLRHACVAVSRRMRRAFTYSWPSSIDQLTTTLQSNETARQGYYVIEKIAVRLNPNEIATYGWLSSLSDSELLTKYSTSPHCEPACFCSNARSAFLLLIETGDTSKWFVDGDRFYDAPSLSCKDWTRRLVTGGNKN